jgi:LysR family transcriptional regulator, nitrogen assimilation regulatory protein
VAQPALSRQVRALEVELRQTLLERNGRGVTLTEPGKRLLGHARGILAQVERARLDLEDQRGAATGHLTLALPPTLSRTLTMPLVSSFRQHFPKATLSVLEGLSAYSMEWLAQGRVDCAAIYNAMPSAAVELTRVVDEALYLVAPRPAGRKPLLGPAITLAELAQCALTMPSRPHAIRMVLETALAHAGLKPRVVLEIESIPALLELASTGQAQAVLSLNALRGSAPESRLWARPITRPVLKTTLWLATSAQRPNGPLLEQALPMLQGLMKERLAKT